MLRGRLPSIRHWGTFGCDAYCHLPKEQRAALAPKSDPCIYLGHHSRQNCASVYVLRTGKVIQTRDVIFRNNNFTFGRAVTRGISAVQRIVDGDEEVDHDKEPTNPDSVTEWSSGAENQDELGDVSELEPPPQYDIERIIGHRVRRHKREFHVRWIGYAESEATWEPEASLKLDAPQITDGTRLLVSTGEATRVTASASAIGCNWTRR
jgi:hypothetical protein